VCTCDKGAGGFVLIVSCFSWENLRDEIRQSASFCCSAQALDASHKVIFFGRNTRAHTGSVVNFLGVKRSCEVPRIHVHVIVEMQDNKAKAVNFCLVEECDRYEARACQILCEAGGVGFFELVSENPLRKGVFAVQE